MLGISTSTLNKKGGLLSLYSVQLRLRRRLKIRGSPLSFFAASSLSCVLLSLGFQVSAALVQYLALSSAMPPKAMAKAPMVKAPHLKAHPKGPPFGLKGKGKGLPPLLDPHVPRQLNLAELTALAHV